MQIHDELLKCPRFSPKYRLPVGDGVADNPWLELAIADKIMRQNGEGLNADAESAWAAAHYRRDEYLDRWPLRENADGSVNRGGLMSQDELIGAAYMSKLNAVLIMRKLCQNFGFYRNEPTASWYKSFQFRFPWAVAYYASRADHWMNTKALRATFVIHVKSHTDEPFDGATPHLLIFVMMDEMAKYPECAKALQDYQVGLRMRGITWPRIMLDYFKDADFWFAKYVAVS